MLIILLSVLKFVENMLQHNGASGLIFTVLFFHTEKSVMCYHAYSCL